MIHNSILALNYTMFSHVNQQNCKKYFFLFWVLTFSFDMRKISSYVCGLLVRVRICRNKVIKMRLLWKLHRSAKYFGMEVNSKLANIKSAK